MSRFAFNGIPHFGQTLHFFVICFTVSLMVATEVPLKSHLHQDLGTPPRKASCGDERASEGGEWHRRHISRCPASSVWYKSELDRARIDAKCRPVYDLPPVCELLHRQISGLIGDPTGRPLYREIACSVCARYQLPELVDRVSRCSTTCIRYFTTHRSCNLWYFHITQACKLTHSMR